jgi:hypothetical protein
VAAALIERLALLHNQTFDLDLIGHNANGLEPLLAHADGGAGSRRRGQPALGLFPVRARAVVVDQEFLSARDTRRVGIDRKVRYARSSEHT